MAYPNYDSKLKNNKQSFQNVSTNKNPYDDIFPSIGQNTSHENTPHDPDLNPYDNMEDDFAAAQPNTLHNPYSRERHTTEFVPKDIVEFARHIDARSRAREIRCLAYSLPCFGLWSIFSNLLVDDTASTVSYMIIHTVILTVFCVIIKKTYSKNVNYVFAVYTAICTIIMMLSYTYFYNTSTAYSYIVFAYTPFVCQIALNIDLFIALKDYYAAWEIYQQTGAVPPKSTTFKEKMLHLDEWVQDRT
ncbi:MAG: hypothetical protein II931_07375 [Clostridia bacterium]|nr:hypothetical protein [Clostridia bacterium]